MSVSAVVPNAPVRRGRPLATRRHQAVVPHSTHTDDSVRVRPGDRSASASQRVSTLEPSWTVVGRNGLLDDTSVSVTVELFGPWLSL